SGVRIVETKPHRTRGVEDHAATREEIAVRTERESGRLAVLHLERFFDRGGMRIDPLDRPRVAFAAAGAVDFWYGDVEPSSARIPHRLLGAVGSIRERDPIYPFDVIVLREHSGVRIHLVRGGVLLVVGV